MSDAAICWGAKRIAAFALASWAGVAWGSDFEDLLTEGRRLAAAHKFAEAASAFGRAVEAQPGNTEARLERGRAWIRADQADQAMVDFETVLQREPRNASALAGRARVYLWRHDGPHTMEAARAAVAADERNAEAHFMLGQQLLIWPDYDPQKAEAEMSRALELDPRMAAAYMARGMTRKGHEHCAEAVADANQAIDLDPLEPHFYESRAKIHECAGNDDLALADYDRAIALKPFSFFFAWRGMLHTRANRHGKALADYNEALRRRPDMAEALLMRGYEFTLADRLDAASKDFDKAVQGRSQWPRAWMKRGWFRLRLGQPTGALSDAQTAISLTAEHPENPAGNEAYQILAEAWFQQGDFAQAFTWARSVNRLEPERGFDSTPSALLAILAEQRAGHAEKARALLDELAPSAPGGTWLAQVLATMRGEKTGEQLIAAAGSNLQRTEAYFYAGQSLLLAGQPGAARTNFEWVRAHGKKESPTYGLALAELGRAAPPKE